MSSSSTLAMTRGALPFVVRISMGKKSAKRLRKPKPSGACKHEELIKEYLGGMESGDYRCTSCGEARWGSSWNKGAQR
jgi:hypothetical protein